MKHLILALCVVVALAGSAMAAGDFKMNSLGVGTNPSGNTGQIDATTVKASGLTSGRCVETSTGGLLTATAAACAASGGGGIFSHTLTGTTPTVVLQSATIPGIDVETITLSANSTAPVMTADTVTPNDEIVIIKEFQPTSGGPFTAITPTAGAGTSVVNLVPGGACPAIPTAVGNELVWDLHYNALKTRWEILACATYPGTAQSAYSYSISAGVNIYGNNTDYPTGQPIVDFKSPFACHFTNLTSRNTFHTGTCTTAPTFNVYDGASNTGTAQIASSSVQSTRGTATQAAQTQAIAAGDTYGIYVSTAGGTCTADLFSVTADITCP